MKKRLFTGFLSVLLLVVMSIFGFACDQTKNQEKEIALDVAAKELTVGDSFTLTATTTPQDGEIVWSSSDEAIVTVDDGTVLAVSVGTATVTAQYDTATATCVITVKAAPVQTYTVTFKNGGTVLKTADVAEGATASYSGALPSKPATAQYEYTFAGWATSEGGEAVDLASTAISANTEFYAVFVESLREYTVTWSVDGTTTSETLVYGATPEYKGTTPTKPTVGNTSYTFIGWAASLSGEKLDTLPTVAGDVTYYAVFDEVTLQTTFTVVWKNGDAILETDEKVEFEAAPEYSGATPTKDMTTENEFVFDGWAASADGEKLETLPVVTADVTYYAVFKAVPRMYTITWVIEGVDNVGECAYGSVPAYEGTPTKEDSSECSYKFDGWALTEGGEVVETLPTCEGENTFYAVFSVDTIFEAPKFTSGVIMYSVRSEEAFLPEGLLGEGVTITSAALKIADETSEVGYRKVTAYENGAWVLSALNTTTVEDGEGNAVVVNVVDQKEIIVHTVEVLLSDGSKYTVTMNVYAGIIDELSDFPAFFNNTAVPSEFDAATYPAVAPNVYGYYIVTKDLGTGAEELSFTQEAATDYQKTNGFNGVLDGQGYTLRFKLKQGGLVGLVLGNAVIKNLGVIYEDLTSTYYGVFGYITNGSPEIRNCYIERTNNHYQAWSVFGIMSRPNAKLVLHNTVVYGYNVSNNCAVNSNMWINQTSTNAYVIHARGNAMGWVNVQNFTKVFTDAVEDGSREVLLSEIEDASGFDNRFWSKENGKLIWKGIETVTVTWVKGEETTTETLTKGDWIMYTQTLPENTISNTETVEYYWSKTEDGKAEKFGDRFKVDDNITYYMVENRQTRLYTVTWSIDGETTTTDYEYGAQAEHDEPIKAEDDYYTYEFKGWSLSDGGELVELSTVTGEATYYAVFEATAKISFVTVNEAILYSTADDQLFLPTELTLALDESVTVTSRDGAISYYENGAWAKNFDLTDEQINANAIGETEVAIKKGAAIYLAKVKSYAGIIDELADFPKFFNNEAVTNTNANNAADYPMVAPSVYGYYIVTKDLGTGVEEVAFTQCEVSNFTATCGFNGVLDGQGHTLRFKLMSGGLVGQILGNATIKNLAVMYEDATSTYYGVFGYMTSGNPVIENCYIERTNNHYKTWSVFGIMSRPNARLILKNTVVYGFNISNNCAVNSNMWISANSTNAYLVCARGNAMGWVNVQNFTKVYTNGTGSAADVRGPLATDVADASGFNECWTKGDYITWKGAADMSFSAVLSLA